MSNPTPNLDESLISDSSVFPDELEAPFVGNFHKTLPHDQFGEVDASAYRVFERLCEAIEAGAPASFESVPRGPLVPSPSLPQTPFVGGATPAQVELGRSVARLVSPLAGAASETWGPDPKQLEMGPAPSCRSLSALAELVELYWMALLRDAPLLAFQAAAGPPPAGCAALGAHDLDLGYGVVTRTAQAVSNVDAVLDAAVRFDRDPGRLRTPTDLASGPGGAAITTSTLFRAGLPDEQYGPLLSQFFLHDVGFGVQTVDVRQVPYLAKRDFLVSHGDWLLAQNTGKDKYGRDYPTCNHYGDQLHRGAKYYPAGNPRRIISTMRDLARFVNRDALHQAYFNAALFLLSINAPLNGGNPYRGNRLTREAGFASLGGPDLLTLVSEVASRALKVVWRQKWLVHRRCRPEVFGGMVQMQRNGLSGVKRPYGIPLTGSGVASFDAAVAATLAAVEAHNAGLGAPAPSAFLPLAYSAGSPAHPAYGAGHASVAGACVTVLKAWFDEDVPLARIYRRENDHDTLRKVAPLEPGGGALQLLQPGFRAIGADLEAFCPPAPYVQPDAERLTVGGELNKLAANVALGRSMGGVHWRSDNTRSLRLGEEVAIEILRKRSAEYAERPLSFSFRSFDGVRVHICQGGVERG